MTLAHPFWHAQHGLQRAVSLTAPRASRYRSEFASQGALREDSSEAWHDLASLTPPGETVDVFHAHDLQPPPGWARILVVRLQQMRPRGALPDVPPIPPAFGVRRLGVADVPAMLDLVALTQPGPFRDRTVELGPYLGVFDGDRLVAMAGTRAHLEGHREISAVCTHPDHQRRGLALALVATLVDDIRREGDEPFLHVNVQNTVAIASYHRLGFEESRQLTVTVVRRTPPALTASREES